jgi:hypothetical protein
LHAIKKTVNANIAKAVLASALFSLSCIPMLAFECVLVTTTQKSSPNPTVRIFNGEKPYANAMVIVTQIIGENGATKEVVRRQADSNGIIKLTSLPLGGSYIVWVLEKSERYESLSFEIAEGGLSDFELRLPAPVEPLELLELKSLRGEVIDPTGALIQKVKIKVKSLNTDSQEIQEFATDDAGKFVANLRDGEYQLTFKENGFLTAIFPVVIKRDSKNGWNAIQLKMLVASTGCGGDRPRYEVSRYPN